MDNNLKKAPQANQRIATQDLTDDEIDLYAFFLIIWKSKVLIMVITVCFTVAGVAYALYQPNIYQSQALLAPAEQGQSGGLGALSGQFGGLASLAGVNLGAGGEIDKTQLALEVLNSRKFISYFIQQHRVLPELMAAKTWERETNTLTYDEEIYLPSEKKWVREVEPPFKPEPSMQEAYKKFKEIVATTSDKDTGMVTLSVEHLSPHVAKQWVDWLIADINQTMKERDVLEADKSIKYLSEQIEQTKIADIRAVLYGLVEEQAKTIMFANVRTEYVFKTIDPAIASEEKYKPKRALIAVLGLLLGIMFGVVVVLTRNFLRNTHKV